MWNRVVRARSAAAPIRRCRRSHVPVSACPHVWPPKPVLGGTPTRCRCSYTRPYDRAETSSRQPVASVRVELLIPDSVSSMLTMARRIGTGEGGLEPAAIRALHVDVPALVRRQADHDELGTLGGDDHRASVGLDGRVSGGCPVTDGCDDVDGCARARSATPHERAIRSVRATCCRRWRVGVRRVTARPSARRWPSRRWPWQRRTGAGSRLGTPADSASALRPRSPSPRRAPA